jgi:hypothetical protein
MRRYAMYDRHPDVSDEEIGIRAFKVKKAKAVERAVQRLRHGMGGQWQSLTDDEIEETEWVLGELWGFVRREEWEDLPFGRLAMGDVVRLLTLGSELRRYARPSSDILRDMEEVVKAKGTEVPHPEG